MNYNEKLLKAKSAIQSKQLNGLVPRGAWAEKNIYMPQDIVYFKGKTYICITSTQGTDPKKSKDFVPFAGNGKDGIDARNIEVGKNNTHIRWRYIDSAKWYDLVDLDSLVGEKGDEGQVGKTGAVGKAGENGKQVQIQVANEAIQWRYEGGTWINLIKVSELVGPRGAKGEKGDPGLSAYEIWLESNVGSKKDFLESLRGPSGRAMLGRGGGGATTGVQSVVAGTNVTVDNTDPQNPIVSASGGAGSGDVTGPASSTGDDFVQFNGATGKIIKDGGLSLDVDGTLAANSDVKIPSQKAVKTYADTKQPLDSDLTSWAAITRAAGFDTFVATPSGANLAALLTSALPASKGGTGLTSLSANVVSVLSAADYAAIRALLGLVIGTNVQAWDADLDTWATKTAPSGTVLGTTDTQTLTNKRVTPRVTSIASSATPTINTDNCDAVDITALATNITSMTSSLSGTPSNFDRLTIRFKDNGSARTIAWGASFSANGVALPTTTVISKLLTVGFIWNGSTWGCVASAQEA